MAPLQPRDETDLCQIIRDAGARGEKIELQGGGTRIDFGSPREATVVSLTSLAGIVDYDPPELVLTVRPGTRLAQVEELLAEREQMLAFEPWGDPAATIGGTIAAGVAGSRRITAGSARDHLLGFTAASGRGELFVAGGKVVKNVTGYDLPKLMAGSWGRLGAMTEITLKVLPRPAVTLTVVARGLSARAAHALMARALGSNAEVSAAAHLARGLTLLRMSGFEASVEARCAALTRLLADQCALERMEDASAADVWREAMTGRTLKGAFRWRVHVPARRAPDLLERLAPFAIDWAMDWGGARLWIATDDSGPAVRDEAGRLGGEADLVSAPCALRRRIAALHPRAPGVAALEQRVRRAFDPLDIFATGRFREDAHADLLSA